MTAKDDGEADVKRAVLDGVLARAPQEGFTAAVLQVAAAAAGAGEDVFAAGIAAVIGFWSAEIDAELERRLHAMDLAALPVRQRIRAAVLTRLDIIKPHKEAARKAAGLPQHLARNAETLWHSADIIWRAAGDRSTDFNFYTKRAILSAILTSTTVAWFGDDTQDERHTAAFLDARIDNVLQYEKLKTRFKEACGTPSAPPSGKAS